MRISVVVSSISIVVMGSAATAAPSRQPQPAAAQSAELLASHAMAPPNFDAMLSMFDKLFPPQPEPDPARLAQARTAVLSMWPDGAYGKMMSSFVGSMFDRAMKLKTSDFTAMAGMPAKTNASATARDLSFHDQAAADDPYFDRRMAAYRQLVDEESGSLSAVIDPRMRDGLARSMARRFDAQQLADINAFFATSSGHALASQYMQLWFAQDTLRSLFTAMPEMMKMMPNVMQKMKAIDAKFPKPAGAPAKDAKLPKQ